MPIIDYNGFSVHIPDGFYNILHTWERIESRSRSDEFDEGLQACVADPLWFISRQWQLGELQAEDAGSLVKAEVEYDTELINQYKLDMDSAYQDIPYGSDYLSADGENRIQIKTPLEVVVEQEKINWNWRMRVRAGQQFERIIRENKPAAEANTLIEQLKEIYKITEQDQKTIKDIKSKRLVSMMKGKALNGERLWNVRSQLGNEYENIIPLFTNWYDDLFSQPDTETNSSWQPETLEYNFSVQSTESTQLISEHYRNGDLEWYSSNHQEESTSISSVRVSRDLRRVDDLIVEENPLDARLPQKNKTISLTPTRVSFGGMPEPRWWTMDDGSINLSKLDVAKTELIKNMFLDFSLIHGDDWFLIPLNLPTGSLTTVKTVTTTDVFGVQNTIENGRHNDPDPLKRWDLFSLSKNKNPKQNADNDYLYIPPSSGFREESEPIEDVSFIRDEQANMVFGIEKTAPNDWGKGTSVYEYHLEIERLRIEEEDRLERERLELAAENGGNAITPAEVMDNSNLSLTYKLATPVPKNWIPYLPVRIEEDQTNSQVFLKQARLPSVENELTSVQQEDEPLPKTRVLNESIQINEETITRAGIKVQITKQRLRWIDGKTYVWTGRKIVSGRGEGSSGLEFDVIASYDAAGDRNDS